MSKYTIIVAAIAGLVLALAPAAQAVTIETVFVGNAGNAADTTGYGAVVDDYYIGKYEVTVAEWDAYITRNTGTSTDNLPRVSTGWVDMARFANWLHNGQPATGGTETGAYTIPEDVGNGYTQAGNDIVRNADWQWAIASEDEWYKAAYHDKTAGLAGTYFDYPTTSDTVPTAEAPPGGTNSANAGDVVGTLTDVGSYLTATSPYGTFDQAGNAYEWTETLSTYFAERVTRAGAFNYAASSNIASSRDQARMSDIRNNLGFRLVNVPEPATMALLGLGGLGMLLRRRRR